LDKQPAILVGVPLFIFFISSQRQISLLMRYLISNKGKIKIKKS